MLHNDKENPLYAQFNRLLEIAYKHDVTLSLGDGLRPGSILDATDRPQIEEHCATTRLKTFRSEFRGGRNTFTLEFGGGVCGSTHL